MTEVLFETRPGVSKAWVQRIVEGTLRAEKTRGQIDILVTDNRSIRKINKRFLKHDYATDVVSFLLSDTVGNIVVSAEFAKNYSKVHKISYREELARYLVHGTLHLFGYDDKKEKDFVRMHARQERIIASFREIG